MAAQDAGDCAYLGVGERDQRLEVASVDASKDCRRSGDHGLTVAERSIAARASCSSSSPGSPLTPTAPTRRPSSKMATPPRKKVKKGSTFARSTGSSRAFSASCAVSTSRRFARPCKPCAARSASRVSSSAVHGRRRDQFAVRVGHDTTPARTRLPPRRQRSPGPWPDAWGDTTSEGRASGRRLAPGRRGSDVINPRRAVLREASAILTPSNTR